MTLLIDFCHWWFCGLKFSISDSFTDLLEIYFDKYLLDKIDMIPEEQAAIVTFSDPKGFSSNFNTDIDYFSTNVFKLKN